MVRSIDITRGGANKNDRMSFALLNPTNSGLPISNMVNKPATPAPSECPTTVSRYLHRETYL